MERKKRTPLLQPLLLALTLVCSVSTEACSFPQHENLTCYNDYNQTISCVWNSTGVSDHTDTVCRLDANMADSSYSKPLYRTSCILEPITVSRPAVKNCSLVFKRKYHFASNFVLSITLSCGPVKILSVNYEPVCHIKLNPPRKPEINVTSISWFPAVTEHKRFSAYLYISQLQWKQKDKSWSDPSLQKREKQCKWQDCKAELDPDQLIENEMYEARIRVKPDLTDNGYETTWSDWSPTASWVSPIGTTKPPPPEFAGSVLGRTFGSAGAAAIALFLAILLFKTDKTSWVYMVKKIRGPPLPNPEKSFLQDGNFQSWLSPHFTKESLNSSFNPEEFVSVEVTCKVDSVAPGRPEMDLLEKIRNESSYDSTISNLSNPSYSHLDPPPPITSLTAGNLAPCVADTPYGPVGGQGECKAAEQDRKVEERGKEVVMQAILDYSKKLQAERVRLQSLDSGVCSGEEVSQESLEADSINVTDGHDGEPQGKEEREGENGKDIDFRKLFGNISSGGIFSKGSIQVCSDYERVQVLQADSNELLSLDSGISSGGEEQVSQEESLEDIDKSTESTSLLFPVPPSSALQCSLPFSTPLPLSFSGPGLSPAQHLPSHIVEGIALMSTSRSVEPCGDGYIPVRQE